jgi:pyridoxine/pyridoxamine 5'-phosphate oxidase
LLRLFTKYSGPTRLKDDEITERTPVAEQPLTDGAKTTRWAEARQRLENPERGRTYRLATVHPDGRPHVMPLLGLWLNGAFSFVSGESTRKGKNLAGDARCVITTSSTALPALDIIIEGDARKVTDDGLRSSRHHWHGAGSRERRRIQPDPLAILDISPQ